MRKKINSLHATLVNNYIVFLILMIVTLFAAVVFIYLITTQSITKTQIPSGLSASHIAKTDYRKIDAKEINKLNGWVEIIENYKIVYLIGNKSDNNNIYSQKDIENFYKSGYIENGYLHSAAWFQGEDRKNYICLVKIPRKSLNARYTLFFTINDPIEGSSKRTLLFVLESFLIIVLLLIINISLYSKITYRKFTKPLELITAGIKKMAKENYETRLDYKAEKEFVAIRDAFNDMADKLQASEAARKETEERKKHMLLNISHDLKTPITTICGYAKALNADMVSEEKDKKKYLQYIIDKSIMVNNLINELFTYTKLDMQSYPLKKEVADFSEFLRETIASLYMEMEDKDFELNLDIPEYEISFSFASVELYRAITNILNNCLKYNPKGTVISINLTDEEEKVILTIRDNGIGMSEELQKNVFNEFIRGDAARQSDGGTGLGLSIAKTIIELHGGSIMLNSQLGKGSEFIITVGKGK
ncbi:HAMP domain-containing sensor histidine kinase [Clostridium homopropionicum]|nr:HAMP domain-containing sensor histidine kinase [Clostridium homopropionicum]